MPALYNPPAMPGDLAVVILAAGRSTRFRSKKSKLLHELCGRPMIEWVFEALAPLDPAQLVVVYGEHSSALAERYREGFHGRRLDFALQDPPRGTGDALIQAEGLLSPQIQRIIVLPGDAPMITATELRRLITAADQHPGFHCLLTAELFNPTGYGRVVPSTSDPQIISRIVEESDASLAEKAIRTVNAGMYLFTREVFTHLRQSAEQFGSANKKGEYYLPDVVRVAPSLAVPAGNIDAVAGVNDRIVLAHCEAILQQGVKLLRMQQGATFILPDTTYIHYDAQVGEDVEIGPGCVITNGTVIGSGTRLIQGCHLDGCVIGEDCTLTHVHATEARVGNNVRIGPYVNLRPGTVLEDDVRVGNFVETKKARVGRGSKLPHLQYVGDATIGENVNIGAGTIFCNYDGVSKHETVIGDNVFVGSNSSLQAPLTIGEGAFIAMGSSITKDVPPGALAVGRSRQENKDGYAERLREKQRRAGLNGAPAGADDNAVEAAEASTDGGEDIAPGGSNGDDNGGPR